MNNSKEFKRRFDIKQRLLGNGVFLTSPNLSKLETAFRNSFDRVEAQEIISKLLTEQSQLFYEKEEVIVCWFGVLNLHGQSFWKRLNIEKTTYPS
ncbi:hypothetical protein [Paenibacillus polymyxa]|uniref:hypothetical protein n=1 Tax=Paenibacillus polymyxa TaxID=1406 RepID=UPI000589D479|nr:hypothetical protein [Paenibacillus polymyxa]AJE54288.1 hypothetical protein RE92_25210 [Paenibacillus polymyxa]